MFKIVVQKNGCFSTFSDPFMAEVYLGNHFEEVVSFDTKDEARKYLNETNDRVLRKYKEKDGEWIQVDGRLEIVDTKKMAIAILDLARTSDSERLKEIARKIGLDPYNELCRVWRVGGCITLPNKYNWDGEDEESELERLMEDVVTQITTKMYPSGIEHTFKHFQSRGLIGQKVQHD